MRTVRTKVYQFNELNENAKQKAIDNNREINVDYNWWEMTYEDAENIGLKITSFDLDRNKHAAGYFMQEANNTADRILTEHGESCETYRIASEFLAAYDNINNEEEEQEAEEIEEEFLNKLLEEYADMLQRESEYLQSDEAISETLIANEYEFTKDGNIF